MQVVRELVTCLVSILPTQHHIQPPTVEEAQILPPELLTHIASNVPLNFLPNLRKASRSWNFATLRYLAQYISRHVHVHLLLDFGEYQDEHETYKMWQN